METLAVLLENKGFKVNGIDRVDYNKRDTRYFHDEDKPGAFLLKKYMTQFVTYYSNLKNANIKIFNLSHKYPNATKGVLELWLKF